MGTQTAGIVNDSIRHWIWVHAYLGPLTEAQSTDGRVGLQEGKATEDPFQTSVKCLVLRSERWI